MKNKYLKISLLFLVMTIAGANLFATEYDELLGFFKGLYHREPTDSPARFALNEIATRNSWRAFNLLRGNWLGSDKDRKEAAKKLMELRKRIEIGLKWPYKTPPSYEIPYTKVMPKIDGNINDSCWSSALLFKGYYPTNSVEKKNDGSIWKLMWNKEYLYVGAYFPDKNIFASKRRGRPYNGDSLEIFLMPSKRMKKYWEVVIGCNGDLFDGFHFNNRRGGWDVGADEVMNGLKFKALKLQNGFCVEAAIPFSELPNYMLNNQPKLGETIYFTLMRTNIDKKNGKRKLCSPFPFLYDGHNIFGYAGGILK